METLEARLRKVDENMLATEAKLKNAQTQAQQEYHLQMMMRLQDQKTEMTRQQTLLLQKQLSIPLEGEYSNCSDSVCLLRRAACSALCRPALYRSLVSSTLIRSTGELDVYWQLQLVGNRFTSSLDLSCACFLLASVSVSLEASLEQR